MPGALATLPTSEPAQLQAAAPHRCSPKWLGGQLPATPVITEQETRLPGVTVDAGALESNALPLRPWVHLLEPE